MNTMSEESAARDAETSSSRQSGATGDPEKLEPALQDGAPDIKTKTNTDTKLRDSAPRASPGSAPEQDPAPELAHALNPELVPGEEHSLAEEHLPAEHTPAEVQGASAPSKSDCQVLIRIDSAPELNLSLCQKSFHLIRDIVFECQKGTLENFTIRVTNDHSLFEPLELRADLLQEGDLISVSGHLQDLHLNTAGFAELTEAVPSAIRACVLDSRGTEVAACSAPLEIMPFNQWNGQQELLASFVTPNAPGVTDVLSRGEEILSGLIRNHPELGPAFGTTRGFLGYTAEDPRYVAQEAEALFLAAGELKLSYRLPPASFAGAQRIRLFTQVLSERTGTCLDTSCLYATILEGAGLQALLILQEEHAMAAVILDEGTELRDAVIWDRNEIFRASERQEILLVETTLLTQEGASFALAVDQARKNFAKNKFNCCVSIPACRRHYIRPLPTISRDAAGDLILTEDPRFEKSHDPLISSLDLRKRGEAIQGRQKLTREEMWENRLLDLSARNRLLNMKSSNGSVLRILAPLPEHLEDELRKHDSRYFKLTESEFTREELAACVNPETLEITGSVADVAGSFLDGSHTLYVRNETSRPLPQLLRKIAADSRLSYDETGANSLFLSLYSVLWTDEQSGSRHREAPLLLLPVEIKRDPRTDVYSLKVRDEEAFLNFSLMEMMRQIFGISLGMLDTLPLDQYGVDVVAIRDAVQEILPGSWKILKTVCLGNFSFRKYVMWRDISVNSPCLHQSPVYEALAGNRYTGGGAFDQGDTPATLDSRIPFGAVSQIVHLDSSQLDAVAAAASGRSFVLQGPPGTGKSQTITNIIASSLDMGKKVLFVAAKMAALEVVQERLTRIGLDPFCLELHSNTMTKSRFLERLDLTAGEKESGSYEADFPRLTGRLNRQREEINQLNQELHRPVLLGMSLYDALSRISMQGQEPGVRLPPDSLAAVTQDGIDQAETALREIGILTRGRKLSEYVFHGSSRLRPPERLPRATPAELRAAGEAVLQAAREFCDLTGTASGDLSWPRLLEGIRSAAGLLQDPEAPGGLLASPILPQLLGCAEKAVALSLQIRDGRKLLGDDPEDLLNSDLKAELRKWKLDDQRFVLFRLWAHAGSVRRLQALIGAEVHVTSATYPQIMKAALEVQGAMKEFEPEYQRLAQADPAFADLVRKDPDHGQTALDLLRMAAQALGRDSVPGTSLPRLPVDLISRLAALAGAVDAAENFEQIRSELMSCYQMNPEFVPQEPEQLTRRLLLWLEKPGEIGRWTEVNQRLDALRRQGFRPLAEALLRDQIPTQSPAGLALTVFAASLAESRFQSSVFLSNFNGAIFQDRVSQFAEDFSAFTLISRQILTEKLRRSKEELLGTADPDLREELNFLEKARKSRGRNLSIRQIFSRAAKVLPRLTPCMLMSPISVAQYLDPKDYTFDLVLFDEASQLPTSEAAGTIGRGKQVIVVGDPKQMPPTEFFEVRREEETEDADMESILDDCMLLGMPTKTLTWHYRSRHESLIAFSNTMYYKGGLYTFPSPDDMSSQVLFRYVDGEYDRGGSGTNKDESRQAVAYIREFLKDPRSRDISLGVVTFNTRQQAQIEDDLALMFRADPEAEKAASALPEPIFIKNLENVQGDERDVIVFSVGFGRDKAGRVTMNFGPLNRNGGERRLNVALTRARKRMVVFSSLQYEDGRLTPTTPEGVRGLFEFLKYARDGGGISAVQMESKKFEKDFVVRELAAKLQERGYDTRTGIGSSAFRIDLAVKDPSHPDKYLACILADGNVFRNTPSTVDRFIGQPGVLKSLGWKILRFWSAEWRKDPEQTLDDLCARLKEMEQEQEQEQEQEMKKEAAEERSCASVPRGGTQDTSGAPATVQHHLRKWSPTGKKTGFGRQPDR